MATRQTWPQGASNVNAAERLSLALGARLTAFVQEAPQTARGIVWQGGNEFVARVLAGIRRDQALDAGALDAEMPQAVEQFRSAIWGWMDHDREQQERKVWP